MKVKYDWQTIEKTFIEAGHHSGVTLKVLSNRLGIPYQTVRRKAAIEKWHNRRLFAWYKTNATKPDKT